MLLMSDGSEFKTLGTEQLKTLLSVVLRQTGKSLVSEGCALLRKGD